MHQLKQRTPILAKNNLNLYVMNVNEILNQITKTAVKERIFNVEKMPLHSVAGYDSPTDFFGLYREDTKKFLGCVKKDFCALQLKPFYEVFTDELTKVGLDVEKMEFETYMNDSRVQFKMPLKSIEIKNGAKRGDITDIDLIFTTGFDGKTTTSVSLFTNRLICTNGMKVGATKRLTSFKNTYGNEGKIASLSTDIAEQIKLTQGLETIYIELNKKEINEELRNKYIQLTTGYNPKEYSELKPQQTKILDLIQKDIEIELKDSGNNMFGLFNGITRYTNHSMKLTTYNEIENIHFGSGAKLNDLALLNAVNLTNDKNFTEKQLNKVLASLS